MEVKISKMTCKKYLTYFGLLFVLLLTSCNREESDIETIINQEEDEPVIYHDTEIIGLVTDKRGTALNNVSVAIENNKLFSNQDGVYIALILKQITMAK
jgi:hypothetical protein